jgi:hypothetical protein
MEVALSRSCIDGPRRARTRRAAAGAHPASGTSTSPPPTSDEAGSALRTSCGGILIVPLSPSSKTDITSESEKAPVRRPSSYRRRYTLLANGSLAIRSKIACLAPHAPFVHPLHPRLRSPTPLKCYLSIAPTTGNTATLSRLGGVLIINVPPSLLSGSASVYAVQ